MKLNTYQKRAMSTMLCPAQLRAEYTLLGLASEVGEVTEIVEECLDRMRAVMGLTKAVGKVADVRKKYVRNLEQLSVDTEKMKLELGDALYYVAAAAHAYGLTLEEVADANIDKLRKRQERGELLERAKEGGE